MPSTQPQYIINGTNMIYMSKPTAINSCILTLKTNYCASKDAMKTRKSPLLITQPLKRVSVRTPAKITNWPTPLIHSTPATITRPETICVNPSPHKLRMVQSNGCVCLS